MLIFDPVLPQKQRTDHTSLRHDSSYLPVHLSAVSKAGSNVSIIFLKLCRVADLEILEGTLNGLNNLFSFSGVEISA